ncbi:MAG TPA: AGE family epimerase/isomerase [Bacillota bacterium]|nr:AGE family epimerase/isomerase [Bacillota bacterium]
MDKKYTTELSIEAVRSELCERIIPFWSGLIDQDYGGFYGSVDNQLNIDRTAFKGCILNSRILWFFSSAYMLLGNDELLVCANHAYRFMRDFCIDREHGGVYWSVTYDGVPLDTTKHTYNQAFAIYALSAYNRASGETEALIEADRLYELIESRCRDEGGYLEAFDIDWHPASNDKLSENGIIADRTMNTLLHVIEAYTNLFDVGHEKRVAERLKSAISTVADKVYSQEKRRLEVFFDNDMNPLIDLHSYGHDIEAAWLIDRACDYLGDAVLTARMKPICESLEDNILTLAVTENGLLNECDCGVVNRWRIWWGQAEGVLGFYNAWQKRPEREDFLYASRSIWRYICEHIVDKREGGEWFWAIDEDGRTDPGRGEVEQWKCPYHNGRMCMELLTRMATQ